MGGFMREWSHFLKGVRLGSGYSDAGWRMPFVHADVAWLCRALAGESSGVLGPPSEAIAFTMINYAFWRRNDTWERRGGGYTIRPPFQLNDVLLAYCQPINPYWRDKGTPHQVERRHKFATMTPGETEMEFPGLIDMVIAILRGEVSGSKYRGLVEFAECSWGEGHHGPSNVSFGNNCFWYSPDGSSLWREDLVQVVQPKPMSASCAVVPFGLELAGAAVVALGPKYIGPAIAIPFLPP